MSNRYITWVSPIIEEQDRRWREMMRGIHSGDIFSVHTSPYGRDGARDPRTEELQQIQQILNSYPLENRERNRTMKI